MQVGVDYSEDYADRRHISGITRVPAAFARAGRTIRAGKLLRISADAAQVGRARRCSITRPSTPRCCAGHEARDGCPLADMLSDRNLVADRLRGGRIPRGRFHRRGDGRRRLNATLSDLCRFGELIAAKEPGRETGDSAEVVADIRRGGRSREIRRRRLHALPGYSYRNMWWVS